MIANMTALLSTLITANHILSYHNVLDPFGHVSVRNPNTNSTFFIALQLSPAVVSGSADIGEYLISDGSPVNGTAGGYAERYIHSEIMKRYPDVNAVVHSHSEDVLPYTVIEQDVESVYHMAGFLGTFLSILSLPLSSPFLPPTRSMELKQARRQRPKLRHRNRIPPL
jgi:ribulose-5-phosphate 4-epimerase/fuculose-1-phosphate aldolase